MTRTLDVILQNGTFQPVDTLPASIPEGARAKVVFEEEAPQEIKPFTFGLHAGMGWMSDDFDDELPDSFWLGE